MNLWIENWKKRRKVHRRALLALGVAVLALAVCMMLYGRTLYGPDEVIGVLFLQKAGKAAYTIRTLRLPRMLCALLSGAAFGMAGNTFQKLLGNPLASPDIIGITSGTSVAAVFCILFLRLPGTVTSILSVAAGLCVAALIYVLAGRGGFMGARLILTGIGIQAFLRALISWMLLRAAQYDVSSALRWMSGSLNYVDMSMVAPLAIVCLGAGGGIIALREHIKVLQLGDPHAVSLGLSADRSRLCLILLSLLLIGFGTAVTGPIASVSFLSGPIASRILGEGRTNLAGSALVGAILVMAGDMVGQYALPARYPVGVVTGIIGAPYLLYLLFRMNKKGGKLS